MSTGCDCSICCCLVGPRETAIPSLSWTYNQVRVSRICSLIMKSTHSLSPSRSIRLAPPGVIRGKRCCDILRIVQLYFFFSGRIALHVCVCDHVVHATRYDCDCFLCNLLRVLIAKVRFVFFCAVSASGSTMFAAASCCLCCSSSRSYVVTQPNRLLMRCAACANGLARSSSCCCGGGGVALAVSADMVRGAPSSGAAWPIKWARMDPVVSFLLAS